MHSLVPSLAVVTIVGGVLVFGLRALPWVHDPKEAARTFAGVKPKVTANVEAAEGHNTPPTPEVSDPRWGKMNFGIYDSDE